MQKRLSRYEMFFTLGFLFMLVCAVAAFFYGVQIGSTRTEERIQMKQLGAQASKSVSYQQQDLVSFYHTVYLSFREFQNEWIDTVNNLESGQASPSSSVLKDLNQLAKEKIKEVQAAQVSKSGPLLMQARDEYINSLNAFAKSANTLRGNINGASGSTLVSMMNADVSYKEGKKQALLAQRDYYSAMLKWSSSINSQIPSQYALPATLEISAWKKLPLTVKNSLMAELMLNQRKWTAYMPQDMSSRVDQFIKSGEAAKFNVTSINGAVDLLTGTDAIRSGDFLKSKNQLYANETLPQLPFFIPSLG